MSKKQIALSLSSPVLREAVTEQLLQMSDIEISEQSPDLIIADTAQETSLPQLLLGRPNAVPQGASVLALPVRLGAIGDQLRYLLSNRIKMAALARDAVDLGEFILEPDDSHLLHKESGQIIRLTDKERLFLLTLYDAQNHAMDRKSLLDAVWGYAETAETHTLETHLYRLRQKLEACPAAELIISGDGQYRLNI